MNRKKITLIIAIIAGCYAIYIAISNKQESSSTIQFPDSSVKASVISSLRSLLPVSPDEVVHHYGYSLGYNKKHDQAAWTAHLLTEAYLVNRDYKRPYFQIDPEVKSGAADWRNYRNSGYDKGHLVPAADREYSRELYEETFLTSNISPQEHDFNAGIWNRLEQKTRYYAKRYDSLYVFTGPIFKTNTLSIGKEQVTVPSAFYKIMFRYQNSNATAIAFIIPHQKTSNSIYTFLTTVDEIEKQTNIDFLSALPDVEEAKIEGQKATKNW